jgi:hypothetical protein
MLVVIGLEICATKNWVLQVVLGPLACNEPCFEKKSLKIFCKNFLSSAFVLYEGWGTVDLPLNMTTFTPDLTPAWYNIKLMDIVASTTALLLQYFTAWRSLSVSNKNQHDFLKETFTAQNYFIQFVYILHILSIQGIVPVLRHL